MRTPQRVEQFQKELEIKKAKAARDALRRQQASAGLNSPPDAKSTATTAVVDPEIVPAVIEAAPEAEAAPSVVESEVSQAVEAPAEQPTEAVAETVEVPAEVVSTTSRKRKT